MLVNNVFVVNDHQVATTFKNICGKVFGINLIQAVGAFENERCYSLVYSKKKVSLKRNIYPDKFVSLDIWRKTFLNLLMTSCTYGRYLTVV